MSTPLLKTFCAALVFGITVGMIISVVMPQPPSETAAPRTYPIINQKYHAIQNVPGTALLLSGEAIADKGHYIAALSAPFYSKTRNSRVYLIDIEGGAFNVVGETAHLPKEVNPQAIAIHKNTLIVSNHLSAEDSVVMYDLGAAFSGTLKKLGSIPNIFRPTGLLVSGDRLYITSYGSEYMAMQGLYVYEATDDGWEQVANYLYSELFDSDDFNEWPDLGPIALTIVGNIAYVANQYSANFSMFDLGKNGKEAYLGHIKGPMQRILYPLGISHYRDTLYFAEHIHSFIAAFPVSKKTGDRVPRDIITFSYETPYEPCYPYGFIAQAGYLFTGCEAGHIMMSSLKEGTHRVATLPDAASVTSFTRLSDARD